MRQQNGGDFKVNFLLIKNIFILQHELNCTIYSEIIFLICRMKVTRRGSMPVLCAE